MLGKILKVAHISATRHWIVKCSVVIAMSYFICQAFAIINYGSHGPTTLSSVHAGCACNCTLLLKKCNLVP